MTDRKMIVKHHDTTLEKAMTKSQAKRYGDRHMPRDLRAAGFETVIFTADEESNGWAGYRINYGYGAPRARGYNGRLMVA